MKKLLSIVLLIGLLFTLSGCIYQSNRVESDFENCLEDECTEEELESVFEEYLFSIFEDSYRDLQFEDDLDVSWTIDVSEYVYVIAINYEQIGSLFSFGSMPTTLDFIYLMEDIEEKLLELDSDKVYTISTSWVGEWNDTSLIMQFVKEQGEIVDFYLNVRDQSRDYNLILEEALGFLGTYELLMEYADVNVNIAFVTNEGNFVLDCEDDSFLFELQYFPESSVSEPENLLNEFKGLVEVNKRSRYTIQTIPIETD